MKMRKLDQFDDAPSVEKLKARSKRHDKKLAIATEALVDDLAQQNKKLSAQNLVLTKLYRACYRLLPASAQKEIDSIRESIDALSDFEVHP